VVWLKKNLDPRKNLNNLFKAFSILKNKVDFPIKLVVVCRRDKEIDSYFLQLANDCNLSVEDYVVTGYINDEKLIHLYKTCDLFVFPSLYEGFGLPCLEAMLFDAPVIGSNTTSVPEVIAYHEALFDPYDPNDIASKMYRGMTDKEFIENLKLNAKSQVVKFSWGRTSDTVLDSIRKKIYSEEFSLKETLSLGQFVEKFKSITNGYSNSDLRRASESIDLLFQNGGNIFIDVTTISVFDAKTGIQRVVRSIIENISDEIIGSVQLVKLVSGGWYEYATEYHQEIIGDNARKGVICPVEGDKFLGLDLVADKASQVEKIFFEWRARGVEISIVVYDILPILVPEYFHEGMQRVFPTWLDMVAKCADNIICISDSVAKDVEEYIAENATTISRRLPQTVSFFHLGADFDAIENVQQEEFQGMQLSKSFLMVGTIEPRKGHADVLSAFKLLQEESNDYNLIIVGKAGWNSDELIRELEQLNKSSQNIHWLKDIDDNVLSLLYQNCCALISASHGEGFGLPLIEAAHHGLPIVARRLPVFLEVAGEGAYYFEESSSPKTIKDTIKNWIEMYEHNEHPTSDRVSYLDWKQSSEKLFQNL